MPATRKKSPVPLALAGEMANIFVPELAGATIVAFMGPKVS